MIAKKREQWFCGWGHIHNSEKQAAKCKEKTEEMLDQHTKDLQAARKKK